MSLTQTDIETRAAELGKHLAQRGWRLATAESCTGGGLAQVITAVPGSSAWFDRGFIPYSNAAKQEMLGVCAATLERHGAVSQAVAREMALGALARSQAQLSVAISGIAGPGGGSADKPVGLVCFAWAWPGQCRLEQRIFSGDRQAVRLQAVDTALRGLSAVLAA